MKVLSVDPAPASRQRYAEDSIKDERSQAEKKESTTER